MEKQFNAGDRVRLKSNGSIVEVVIAKDGWIGYDENRKIAGSCPMEEVEPVDPKTAFLSELKGLLEKYDAKISAYSVGYDGELDLTFDVGNCEVLYSEDNPIFKGHSVHTITADNIMDYDKE